MFTEMSPMWIPLAAFVGCVISPLIGWALNVRDIIVTRKETGKEIPMEVFMWQQWFASIILGIVVAFIELSLYSSAVSIGFPDLMNAALAGIAADTTIKNILKI